MTKKSKNPRTLVLIPAYDEARSIGDLVAEIRRRFPELDVVVVDDGSRDGTGARALEAGAGICRHAFNLGDGAARQTGFLYALRNNYDYVIHLDGDRQHSPEDIGALLSILHRDEADVVVGSRFLGSCTYKLRPLKKTGMKIFSWVCSVATGDKITDPTSGFRGINRKAMKIYTRGHYPQHFPDADVIISSHFRGLRIKETPVTMSATQSKDLHQGGTVFYYVYKMLLSTFVSILR